MFTLKTTGRSSSLSRPGGTFIGASFDFKAAVDLAGDVERARGEPQEMAEVVKRVLESDVAAVLSEPERGEMWNGDAAGG